MTQSTLEASVQADSPAVDVPDAITFESLSLNKPILKALAKSGYTNPTPIQAGAIPHALAGRDLLLSAQTGSGKTAAFVLPILDKLSRQSRLEKHIYALILTPTRELAQQVHDSVRRYGGNIRGLYSIPLVGGSPYSGQIRALRKGVQIVIATPGRLIDHMNEGRVDLSKLDVLVLDEADRMLDMGFADDIKVILQNAPETRQTVMSSATWDGAVGKIAESFTKNPEKVAIKVESGHIEESVYFCDDFHHKNKILLELLNNPEINQAVIFAATKRSTEQLAEMLTEVGLKARYLHGDLPQGKRNRIISDVKNGKCDFLIATDVAARGIDISAISHVINYDLPRQVEDYVHRIGRCGRAGRTGVAMNLCSFDDRGQLRNINRYLKRDMAHAVVEGLEPKRKPFEQREERKGGGRSRDGKKGFGRERRFDKERPRFERERRHDERAEGFDNKPRFERGERFDRQDRRERFDRSERFDRQDRQGYRQSADSYQRQDEYREYERPRRNRDGLYQGTANRQFDHQDRFERGERFGRHDKEFAPRFERGFDKGFDRHFDKNTDKYFDRADRDFAKKERFGRFDGEHSAKERASDFRQDRRERADRDFKKMNKSFDKPRQHKKPKAVEEIFFAKRQAKKDKRRFGDKD